ncbi:MAG TPA: hypothetical protein VMG12_01850, partial [Polyangiaceae bacterium]|nr:hypothetical protein [Polyangiaceae bacterium]
MTAALEHLKIAEEGKRAALRGDHRTALGLYREAMHRAVSSAAPEVFFRHYLEASIESLELLEAFDSVLEYCDRAVAHYAAHPPAHAFAEFDLASIHQRRGATWLKLGQAEAARTDFDLAIAGARRAGARCELAERLLDWVRRGLSVSKERIVAEQKRLRC